MCQYYFTTNDKILLFLGLKDNLSMRKIATSINKNVSSVSREIKKYSINGEYSLSYALEQSKLNRKRCGRHKVLENNPILLNKIRSLIRDFKWSPEQINGRLKIEKDPIIIGTNTIYRAIESGLLDTEPTNPNRKGFKRHLRHGGKPRKTKNKVDNRGKFPISNHICDRPQEAEKRTEIGHWEVDSVLGKHGKSCLITLVDRKSRYTLCGKSANHTADATTKTMLKLLDKVSDDKIKTLTPDRGKEFSKHAEITKTLNGVQFYFPDPHAPWQRGTNENTNGLIREFIPKYTDIDKISQEKIKQMVDIINNRPRKCLHFKTPAEMFF